jgi:hypothetical protein
LSGAVEVDPSPKQGLGLAAIDPDLTWLVVPRRRIDLDSHRRSGQPEIDCLLPESMLMLDWRIQHCGQEVSDLDLKQGAPVRPAPLTRCAFPAVTAGVHTEDFGRFAPWTLPLDYVR